MTMKTQKILSEKGNFVINTTTIKLARRVKSQFLMLNHFSMS